MRINTNLKNDQIKVHLLWASLAVAIWLSIAVIYYAFGIRWLEHTDSGWYWQVVNNLAAFDISIQPLYPIIVRGLIDLFPAIEQSLLGQFVSVTCYALAVPLIFNLLKQLNVTKPAEMTLLWAMFPFVGVTLAVYPRANALLLLFTVLCYWGYVNNNRFVFLLSAALLPLIHKSSLFFLMFLLPIALFNKKVKWWMLLLAGLPTASYILLGSIKHGTVFWYFQSYYKNIVHVTRLPLGDGIIGTLISGFQGSITDLVQGVIIASYFLLAIYMLISKVWRKQLFILSTILPVITLGLVLPAREIWSIFNYSGFSIIAFSLLPWHDEKFLGKQKYKWLYYLLVAFAFLSQVAYAIYELHFYSLI